MSVIAAKVYPDKIEMSCDSIMLKGDQKSTYDKMRLIDDLLVGACGDADEIALMFVFAEQYKPKSATVKDMMEYISEFRAYKEGMFNKDTVENEYLIGYQGKLFLVDRMFVSEVFAYAAIGAASSYALTSLYFGFSTQTAIDAACNLSCYATLPVKTLTLEYKEEE